MPDRSLGEVAKDTAADVRRLIQLEVKLAVEGLKRQARGMAVSLGAAGAGVVFLLFGLLLLLVAGALALGLVLPLWAAFLIVGGGVVVLGLLLGVIAAMGFRSSTPPIPEETTERLAEDAKWLLNKSA
ncbi:MAG TPA: phage holin family protein [Actinomycetota bacterium]|nr:phage holin family protein [Actinomycetota bacterium]